MHPLIEAIYAGATPDFSELQSAFREPLPLLDALADTPQDPEWHAEGDVAIHTSMVVDEVWRLLETGGEGADLGPWDRVALVLGALLHDIAKPLTTREREIDGRRRIVAPRHAQRGRSYLALRLGALGLPEAVHQRVMGLVGYHHDPKQLVVRESRGKLGGHARHAYMRLARRVDIELVQLLELADVRGRRAADRGDQIEIIELFRLMAEEHGVWGESPWTEFEATIRQALEGMAPEIVDATLWRGARDLEAGLISTPHEALQRAYPLRSEPFGQLIVTCAPAGAGKSGWVAQREAEGWGVISLDALREELTGRAGDQSDNNAVIALARERLRQRLRDRTRTVFDATSILREQRSRIVQMGIDYGASVTIAAFAVAPDELHRRNRGRERQVPAHILERQVARLEWPTLDEAHRLITIGL